MRRLSTILLLALVALLSTAGVNVSHRREAFRASGGGAPTTDLVSLWELSEASGTRSDSEGSNDLTDGNTVGQATGKVGNCADFETSNSERLYINDADQSGLSFTGDFSFTGWFNRESDLGSNEIVFSKWSNWTQDALSEYYLGVGSDDKLTIYVSNNGTSYSGATASTFGALSTGTWYFFFAYYDHSESEIGISVNNGTVDTASFTGPLNNSTNKFALGALYDDWAGSWLFHFDGTIDQVRAYSRKLDSSEVTTLYNSGNGL